ncbi:hypothetical protein LCGC14_2522340, partial [marine sediment metagenome]
ELSDQFGVFEGSWLLAACGQYNPGKQEEFKDRKTFDESAGVL